MFLSSIAFAGRAVTSRLINRSIRYHKNFVKMSSVDSKTSSSSETLKLYNSLSRKKEEFVPMNGRSVTWYSCGPTVYDASHMGHARSYMAFDIIRRVMSDYFGYDIFYVMNVTDIDDKIINRARQNHLFEEYKSKDHSLDDVIRDCDQAIEIYKEKLAQETDKDKASLLSSTIKTAVAAVEKARDGSNTSLPDLIDAVRDPLSKLLDRKYGATVTDHHIFAALTQKWEEEYHNDMTALNVLPPNVLTRVTDYVPEIVVFVEKIISNGYAYESNGSVYFNTVKFSTSPDHRYAKLVPENVGDLAALQEGEGELSVSADKLQEKKHKNDFALWKASKPGEPAWPSPWGPGRPGWHIECSVMACDILGSTADIHTGGVDLKFPHHDNEIAQVEAYYETDNWINYFLHAGHLSIEGCKMSKSLKNFITIKEALQTNTSSQLRLAFLTHQWSATMDYSVNAMQEAVQTEKALKEFFLVVKDMVWRCPEGRKGFFKWTDSEKELNGKFLKIKSSIHTALCDSIDTPTTLRLLKELLTLSNTYIDAKRDDANARLLADIAHYMTYLLKIFGVIPHDTGIGFSMKKEAEGIEDVVMPYAIALADFREKVREVALETKAKPVLQLCDWVRDEVMFDLGVKLEDKKERTVVKLVGKEALIEEREAEKRAMEIKRKAKEEQKKKMEEAQRKLEAQARIEPRDMFKDQMDKYSKFDDQGVPTHDENGEPLSEKKIKKLYKQWEAQEKKYNSSKK
ncbi:PREDICTED: cysteine--tRNA ligase, cytoplasmic-like [Amphimedon queenslandica]|uniref:Cysteine--tRNA ligase, cytoplasmic n=1 Tax=Amphimedon queenslandica TaxID=400682 RepID=A0A1X7UGJ6_AMPQE|nr:PREDICTED: cysteine--tRNA ligase, cytoplasmic-like [Amphimedon queenslandica]|eukprot:XP_019854225.1 PREDICTED: cysteine--tRNA ligase, cytoplasmic-like [Amphimedon queenslandica]